MMELVGVGKSLTICSLVLTQLTKAKDGRTKDGRYCVRIQCHALKPMCLNVTSYVGNIHITSDNLTTAEE